MTSKLKRLTVAIGGLHGTGKTTYARAIAETFKLRHVSAGEAFRRLAESLNLTLQQLTERAARDRSIDERVDGMVREEALRGGVVVDGLLSAWMAENAQVKICLQAPDEVRFQRIAKRDGLTFEEAKRLTLEREEAERRRYKQYYGINLDDLSVYDIVFNTELLPLEAGVKVLTDVVKEYVRSRLE